MTEKRLFVGRKTVEDRFTIINDYENEIGVKENRSGDVLVLKHSDLNAQQFVAQLVVFLNDQNQAIVDLYDGSKYWSDKATEKIKELEKENEQLKNKIDVLEDDNETYHKSLEKLNLYTKRFIPTKCTNEFKDCKTNRYYWLDHEGNFEGCLELLNLLDCEKEVLKSENRQLKGRLMEYEEQIK